MELNKVSVNFIKQSINLCFFEVALDSADDFSLHVCLQIVYVVGRHILDVIVESQKTVHETSQLAGLHNLVQPLLSILSWKHHLPSIQLSEAILRIFGPEVSVSLDLGLRLFLLFLLFTLSRVVLLQLILEFLVNQSHLVQAHCF